MAITVNPALGVAGGLKPTFNPQPANNNSPSNAAAVGSGSKSIYDVLADDRAFSLSSARETNEFNAREAQKARDWQKTMMLNSHQWEVEDLKKAGLNPILSANNGANAYNSAVASGVKPDTPSGANAIGNIMAAAMTAGAMVQVARINATSALDVAKEQHQNSIYGTLNDPTWKENFHNNAQGAVNYIYDKLAGLYRSVGLGKYVDYVDNKYRK